MTDKCNVCEVPLLDDPRGLHPLTMWYAEFRLNVKRGRSYSGPIWQEKRCREHFSLPSREDSRAVRV